MLSYSVISAAVHVHGAPMAREHGCVEVARRAASTAEKKATRGVWLIIYRTPAGVLSICIALAAHPVTNIYDTFDENLVNIFEIVFKMFSLKTYEYTDLS